MVISTVNAISLGTKGTLASVVSYEQNYAKLDELIQIANYVCWVLTWVIIANSYKLEIMWFWLWSLLCLCPILSIWLSLLQRLQTEQDWYFTVFLFFACLFRPSALPTYCGLVKCYYSVDVPFYLLDFLNPWQPIHSLNFIDVFFDFIFICFLATTTITCRCAHNVLYATHKVSQGFHNCWLHTMECINSTLHHWLPYILRA